MLPALEKSSDEVANLGKIIVATLKGMMGSTLGNTLEDKWDKVVDARPYNSPSPFIVILDEVGYYCVNGMAIMAAQDAKRGRLRRGGAFAGQQEAGNGRRLSHRLRGDCRHYLGADQRRQRVHQGSAPGGRIA
jgi:hypothetical protein